MRAILEDGWVDAVKISEFVSKIAFYYLHHGIDRTVPRAAAFDLAVLCF